SEEHTSELQSLTNLVCRLLLDKKPLLVAAFALAPTVTRLRPPTASIARTYSTRSTLASVFAHMSPIASWASVHLPPRSRAPSAPSSVTELLAPVALSLCCGQIGIAVLATGAAGESSKCTVVECNPLTLSPVPSRPPISSFFANHLPTRSAPPLALPAPGPC